MPELLCPRSASSPCRDGAARPWRSPREIERRGFSGIYMPSRYGNSMAQCTGLALATERITFGTAIAPIYAQTVEEFCGRCRLHPRGFGRALPLWHRGRARPDASAARHLAGQAVGRYPRLCRGS